jgi:hypothetical protein
MDHRRSDNMANKLQMETAGNFILIQVDELNSPKEMGVLVIDANAGKENAMVAPPKVRWSKTGQHHSVARDSSNPNRNLLCCENATVDISNKGIKRDT